MGLTTALLSGVGGAAAGAANAAPASQSRATVVPASWHHVHTYTTQSKCVTEGHAADVPWNCKPNNHGGWRLYLYY
ncbi:hypothetical protein [Streptomyces sp. XD-27]|uniref:hypothetical protein n=1 Tax=Streptomyces sp. XD-27 TaxID=3062779 RepID=UPI0026F437F5|nr:hypothetical protein [Streptomyces sp. XD-27]WKX72345.1 hypothetical protein Q3Y56_22750 [Streptomyces sp. XD-27]